MWTHQDSMHKYYTTLLDRVNASMEEEKRFGHYCDVVTDVYTHPVDPNLFVVETDRVCMPIPLVMVGIIPYPGCVIYYVDNSTFPYGYGLPIHACCVVSAEIDTTIH